MREKVLDLLEHKSVYLSELLDTILLPMSLKVKIRCGSWWDAMLNAHVVSIFSTLAIKIYPKHFHI